MSAQTHKSKKRLLLLMITVLVLFAGLSAKMAYVVFAQGEELQQKALLQQTKDTSVAPQRGGILDRNGNILAKSANAYTVVIRPKEIAKGNVDSIVSKLSELLEIDVETVRKKATNTTKTEVWLARQISDETATELRKLSLPGVYFTVEIKRYYPNSEFLTQTLGFTSVDGVGLEGIEAYFDEELSGRAGRIVAETDVAGNEIPLTDSYYIAPEDGYNVVLTIDEVLQSFLEKTLEEAYKNENAQGAWGVAIDPASGHILAMECIPDYDLNNIPNDDMKVLTEMSSNKIVKQAYEPGGVFEAITAACALDNGSVDTETVFGCDGYKLVQGQQLKCISYPDGHGEQNIYEAAQNSCSAAFMQMGIDMGTQVFYDYIYEFGFGQQTGLTFPSDQNGEVMLEKYVQKSDLARMTVGQSIAVTPLQLVSSISAVVNGGFLFQPQIVKALQDTEGKIIEEYEPVLVSEPISTQTSALMREILEKSVSDGNAKNCYLSKYAVGGMSGTSLKYDEDGNVLEGKHIDSFLGFAPADDPQIMILIIIDEPSVPAEFGSQTVAPYVRSVLYDSLQYLGIEQEDEQSSNQTEASVPDVTGLSEEEAIKALDNAGLKYIMNGTGSVTKQTPIAETQVFEGVTVMLYMDNQPEESDITGKIIVPNLKGLSIMEASEVLMDFDLHMIIDGGGNATSQNPAAGEAVEEGSDITVQFRTSTG